MNWSFDHHKLYEAEQLRKAENERLAEEAREDQELLPRRRRRFNLW